MKKVFAIWQSKEFISVVTFYFLFLALFLALD